MKKKRYIILGVLILILLAVTLLPGCGANDVPPKESMPAEEALNKLSELLKKDNFGGLTLTIYYKNPFTDTRFPWTVDHLIYGITAVNEPPRENDDANGSYDQKIVVDGDRLKEHIDLLRQIAAVTLIPVEKNSYIGARIYYMFETEQDGKILDVAMFGCENNSMFVNGFEAEGNDIFCDIITPFLPEDSAKELNDFITICWPGSSMEDVITQKETALKIGRAILEEHFPDSFQKGDEPLDAVENDGVWTVYNVLDRERVDDEGNTWFLMDGGVSVEFLASTGEVISINLDG